MTSILVIGGASSGKSGLAEGIIASRGTLPRRYYIATMVPYGEEGRRRVERHRAARRELGFETVERFCDMGGLALPERGDALLEDLGNLTANELFGTDGGAPPPAETRRGAAERIADGVLALGEWCGLLVVVTNDVSRDGVHYEAETEEYIRVIGELNRRLAARFDEVYEAAAGFLTAIKKKL
ncbi:MAG: bifunctional adenosylcobinamide kinase/adenosylcobinamide-phosphate guanylyltransferase [Oscillospiraceae bacterium]|jgi:adenosylcobinamide kinase/adenosylcobinamide-phosphate guanylyltransferase|nr:bifunctional adenosylcobinamide kinase/adenosylcobinamide-phosphate guanylyltransferase [Oscillospiraceae bacterium]